ncbi:MAG TPA: hypothetical protein VGD40_25020 [Chryseosolibacter sp.]
MIAIVKKLMSEVARALGFDRASKQMKLTRIIEVFDAVQASALPGRNKR